VSNDHSPGCRRLMMRRNDCARSGTCITKYSRNGAEAFAQVSPLESMRKQLPQQKGLLFPPSAWDRSLISDRYLALQAVP
jgi:hypothetical protein